MVLLAILATACAIGAVLFWANWQRVKADNEHLYDLLDVVYNKLTEVSGATEADKKRLEDIQDIVVEPHGLFANKALYKD